MRMEIAAVKGTRQVLSIHPPGRSLLTVLSAYRRVLLALAIFLTTPAALFAEEGDWIDLKKGLMYKDLVVGDGKKAGRGAMVTVHYTGFLPDGSVFDTTRDNNKTLVFRLGDGRVIQGWERGMPGMRVGGTRRLKIPAKLAYGKRGVKGRIRPNTDLEFEIELVAVSTSR